VLSGAGLTLALWAWRGLRPAWVLGLAGVTFGGLWVAQYYGPQAMPDIWSALGGLAAAGCFCRWAFSDGGPRALAGLGVSVAFVTLVRPGDAVYVCVPLLVVGGAGVLMAGGFARYGAVAGTTVGGLLAGGAEWVIEAYARFGGIAKRLRAAGGEQGGFGLHFALPAELRALNGPTLCRPCTVGFRDPGLDLWWLALPVLGALGIIAARRAGQLASALLPAYALLDRGRTRRPGRPATLPDRRGAVHPDRLLRRLRVDRKRGARRTRRGSHPGSRAPAVARQDVAQLSHHRHHDPQGQRLYPVIPRRPGSCEEAVSKRPEPEVLGADRG
jgi:hypothetical protein